MIVKIKNIIKKKKEEKSLEKYVNAFVELEKVNEVFKDNVKFKKMRQKDA